MSSHSLPTIVLTGFMGVGKTTVGKILADKLGLPFIDVDQEIEKQHNMPITEIFRTMGESAFRRMERDFIAGLFDPANPKIVSLGGGAFLQEEIRSACLSSSQVFHLTLPWESWKQRMLNLQEGRPLLQNKTPEEIEALFRKRQQTYALSHWTIDTDGISALEAANRIIDIVRNGSDKN